MVYIYTSILVTNDHSFSILPIIFTGSFLFVITNYLTVFFMDAPTQAILSAFSIVLGHGIGDRQAAEQSLTALEVLEGQFSLMLLFCFVALSESFFNH